MAFNAVLDVPNTKTTKCSSETNLWTVLMQAILLEHNTRPAGAFILCQRFSSQKRFHYRQTVIPFTQGLFAPLVSPTSANPIARECTASRKVPALATFVSATGIGSGSGRPRRGRSCPAAMTATDSGGQRCFLPVTRGKPTA